jgi:hypothetical protein
VEGGHEHFPADHVLHTAAHLVGGLVGEGEREDAIRGCALVRQVRDATRYDARLPRAGPGHDQQRAFPVADGAALRVGQVAGDGIGL